MAEESVSHCTITTNGIKMHIAEVGSGPVVLFLHGFPESWYSWRKQLLVFAKAGFRAVAPDLRGYGDSDAPEGVEKYTYLHIVGDLIGLLDALQCSKAFLVTHDWGATIGWYMCLFRPERIHAHAALSVYYRPRHPAGSIVQLLKTSYGEHHYICQFQEPGKAEAMIVKWSPEMFLKIVYSDAIGVDLKAKEGKEITLPDWITDEDIAYYVKSQKCGYTPPINYYRAHDLSWELTAPWAGCKVTVPSIFIIGDKDLVYDFPGAKEYIHGGGFVADVPNLKNIHVLQGIGHFLQQETPEAVNSLILDFLKSFQSTGSIL